MKQEDLIKKLEEIKTPEIEIQEHKKRLKIFLLNSGCFKEYKIMNINVWFKKIAPVGVVFALLLILGGGYLFLQEDREQKRVVENQTIVPPTPDLSPVLEEKLIRIHPDHMRVIEKLKAAKDDLIADGIPFVDFEYRFGYIDPDDATIIYADTLVFIVGLREVREEYKAPIKAVIEGVEGIKFEFFQANFSINQLSSWQDEIAIAIDGMKVRKIPIMHTVSSFREQKIFLYFNYFAGEIKQEYKDAVRAVVGYEAPLEFRLDFGSPYPTNREPTNRESKEYYGSSTYGQCQTDNDCFVSGCNAEICQSRSEEPLVSICIFPDQPTPKQLNYGCQCVNQKCQWSK